MRYSEKLDFLKDLAQNLVFVCEVLESFKLRNLDKISQTHHTFFLEKNFITINVKTA